MKRYIAIIAIIFGIVLFAVIVYAAVDSYRINKTVSTIINEQGSCKSVINNSATNDYFIPTKTLTEWNLFKQNKPADVSLGSCYQCPTTSTLYSDQTTCNSACIQMASCTESCGTTSSYYRRTSADASSCDSITYSPGDCDNSISCNSGDTCIGGGGFSASLNGEYCSSGAYKDCRHDSTSCTFSCPLSGGSICSENTLYNTNGPYSSCVSGNCPSGQGGNSACTCQTNIFQTSNTCTYNSFASGGNNYFDCVYTATIFLTGSASTCTAGQSCTTLP